jgi:hypothetical protein
LCGLMTILQLQAANGRTIAKHSDCSIGSLFRVPLLQLHLS